MPFRRTMRSYSATEKRGLHGHFEHKVDVTSTETKASCSPRNFSCEICAAAFKSAAHLKGHINTVHLKRYRFFCESCGKGFAVREHCQDHMNMHKNLKPHQCPRCLKCFTYKTHLRRHLRVNICVHKISLT